MKEVQVHNTIDLDKNQQKISLGRWAYYVGRKDSARSYPQCHNREQGISVLGDSSGTDQWARAEDMAMSSDDLLLIMFGSQPIGMHHPTSVPPRQGDEAAASHGFYLPLDNVGCGSNDHPRPQIILLSLAPIEYEQLRITIGRGSTQ